MFGAVNGPYSLNSNEYELIHYTHTLHFFPQGTSVWGLTVGTLVICNVVFVNCDLRRCVYPLPIISKVKFHCKLLSIFHKTQRTCE